MCFIPTFRTRGKREFDLGSSVLPHLWQAKKNRIINNRLDLIETHLELRKVVEGYINAHNPGRVVGDAVKQLLVLVGRYANDKDYNALGLDETCEARKEVARSQ